MFDILKLMLANGFIAVAKMAVGFAAAYSWRSRVRLTATAIQTTYEQIDATIELERGF